MINKELFPSKNEIFSWIKDLGQWGHRKTGTLEGKKSAEYIAAKLRAFGMKDVRIEKAPSMCMFVNEYSLEVEGDDVECFYVNGTNRCAESGSFKYETGGSGDEFVYLSEGNEADFKDIDVKGKIVICDIRFLNSHPMDMAKWFEYVDVYDPEHKMDAPKRKTDIYSPNNWPNNYFRAIQNGAAGFVGILMDYMDDPYWYCEDYTDMGHPLGIGYMNIPAMWISRSSGNRIKELFNNKKTLKGRLKMESVYEYKDALNVSGRLEGMSEDYIVVHSHHDAVFKGAVQDASGISEMLALGKYFSGLEKNERPKSMMFVATDTHYTDYNGHREFIKARQEEGVHMVMDLAIEHVGKEAVFDENMQLVETGEVETRLMYISEESNMYDKVIEVFKKYNLEKSIFAKVNVGKGINPEEYEFQQNEVISDAYYFNETGVPIISMVCGEQYLFHPSDTPDRIPLEQLEPVGMAFAELAEEAALKL